MSGERLIQAGELQLISDTAAIGPTYDRSYLSAYNTENVLNNPSTYLFGGSVDLAAAGVTAIPIDASTVPNTIVATFDQSNLGNSTQQLLHFSSPIASALSVEGEGTISIVATITFTDVTGVSRTKPIALVIDPLIPGVYGRTANSVYTGTTDNNQVTAFSCTSIVTIPPSDGHFAFSLTVRNHFNAIINGAFWSLHISKL